MDKTFSDLNFEQFCIDISLGLWIMITFERNILNFKRVHMILYLVVYKGCETLKTAIPQRDIR